MHYAHQVYTNPNEESSDKNNVKWEGSYIHYPLVPEPISVTKHQILKTEVIDSTPGN